MKKRILITFQTPLLNAGVPNVIMQLVRHLKDECTFDIIVSKEEIYGKGFFDEEFKEFGGEIVVSKHINLLNGKIGVLYNSINLLHTTYKQCKKKHYDVIHCHDGNESGIQILAAKIARIEKRIVHVHGQYKPLYTHNPLKSFIWNNLSPKLVSKYSTVKLACSMSAGESAFGEMLFVNVLNPVDVDFYKTFEKKEHNGINLLQIGYYSKLKNQIFSLNVLEELLKRCEDVRLDLVGFDMGDNYIEKVKCYANQRKLSEYVRFLPSDTPKKDIFPETDFLLIPSTSEGLPLVALEAQSAKLRCIASCNVPKEADRGLYVSLDIDDPKCWADYIQMHVNDEIVSDEDKISAVSLQNFVMNIYKYYE